MAALKSTALLRHLGDAVQAVALQGAASVPRILDHDCVLRRWIRSPGDDGELTPVAPSTVEAGDIECRWIQSGNVVEARVDLFWADPRQRRGGPMVSIVLQGTQLEVLEIARQIDAELREV